MQVTRREVRRLANALGVALAFASPLPAVEAPAPEVQEVLDCVQQNLPKHTSVQRMRFASQDRAGGGRTIESKMSWRRFDDGLSRVLVRVHSPSDLKGSGLLLLEKKNRADMFVYLPDLEKVRRVTSRMLGGSMFGSDFTYEDFSQLQGMAVEGRSERLADSDLDGVPVRVVSHYPSEDSGSSYARVTTYVDAATCVPLKSEMFEKGDRLRKVLTADRSEVFESDGVRIPRKLRMEDRRDQSSTELVVTEIEVEVELKERIFTVPSLERPRIN